MHRPVINPDLKHFCYYMQFHIKTLHMTQMRMQGLFSVDRSG